VDTSHVEFQLNKIQEENADVSTEPQL